MLEWTDRHCRFFLRLISRHVRLYTEMVTTGALLHGDPARFLRFDPKEHPIALQLGGSDPEELARCARLGADWGYDEINLNLGCPSNRVQSGRFGACLMAEPERVADCIAAMKAEVDIPVTVKTRIGIDHRDRYEDLYQLTRILADAGCDLLIVHARKAWLQGLSPKENREIPPLRYDLVRRLKGDFPELPIVLNGGIQDLDQAEALGKPFEGVMIGRAAYRNPWILAEADRRFFGDPHPIPTRAQVIAEFAQFAQEELADGVPLQAMTRHLLGLFNGQPGARRWRRHLTEGAQRPGAGVELLFEALP